MARPYATADQTWSSARRRRTLLAAIETLLSATPTVLCRLITEYGYDEPHRWLDDDLLPHHGRVDVKSEGLESELTCHRGYGWHSIISSATLRDGACNWTVVLNVKDVVFVGITTSLINYIDTNAVVAFENSRTIRCLSKCLRFFHDHRLNAWRDGYDIAKFAANISIHFAADPRTKTITASSSALRFLRRIQQPKKFVLVKATTAEEFWSMRPCVIVRGRTKVSLLSGM